MQLRFWASFVVFIGSYFPLSLILLVQDFKYELFWAPICWPPNGTTCTIPLRNGLLSLSIFFVSLICVFITIGVLSTVRPKTPVRVHEAKYIPAELMSYTLPYVVSFMSLDYKDTGKFVGLLIFLGWMFLITYRSGQLILNPLLAVFGWRLYEVSLSYLGDEKRYPVRAMSKDDLQLPRQAVSATIQDVMLIEAKRSEADD
ncbi:hypothetical protein [Sinorhizobium fredii]|uniref:hypothetical protein n=1 Tax=Rhizobium fredii TaxID=380 RepID=UPI00056D17FF|nr:hypothetical protein [Sinorhizobium fredii]